VFIFFEDIIMLQRKLAACAVAFAFTLPAVAMANDSAEMEKIRAEIQQMRESYEARIQTLEAKLKETGVVADRAEESAQRAETTATKAATPPSSPNAFNPEMALILQGAYKDQKNIENRHITGFLSNAGAPSNTRGFSADASEFSVASNVDTWLRGFANIVFVDGAAEVEEAYFQTLGLGYGISLKGGRFRSGIGYQNELHPHAWDFADNNLMYHALFGEGAIQDGVQIKWLAPTELMVELGAEFGRGAAVNNANYNGASSINAFAHVGGDFGASHAWRAGISFLHSKVDKRTFDGTDINTTPLTADFRGRSRIWLADFIYKWAPNGNAQQRNFKLVGEYFHREEKGNLNVADLSDGAYQSTQSGWYVQGLYQFMPRWRVGLRYDQLYSGTANWQGNDIGAVISELANYDPHRSTAALEFNPSEFSRFRLQYAHDQSMQGIKDDQITLQYILSLGAHGAHRF
jgi:hypothetical protein